MNQRRAFSAWTYVNSTQVSEMADTKKKTIWSRMDGREKFGNRNWEIDKRLIAILLRAELGSELHLAVVRARAHLIVQLPVVHRVKLALRNTNSA
eukprot:1192404-Prorocentrum_minimum.AAC.2